MKVSNYVIKANGKEYFLNYSMSAFMLLERNTGIKMFELLKELEEKDSPSLNTMFYLLKAGIDRGMGKNHSDIEVLDFQQDLELEFGVDKAYDKILNIIEKSLNSEKAKRQEKYNANNPSFKKQRNNKKK